MRQLSDQALVVLERSLAYAVTEAKRLAGSGAADAHQALAVVESLRAQTLEEISERAARKRAGGGG